MIIYVKVRRLKLLGYIGRMKTNGITKVILNSKLGNVRRLKTTKTRRITDMKNNLRRTRVSNWRLKA